MSGIQRAENYLDDIVIYGDTEDELVDTLDNVLAALQKGGFRVSLPKISLFKSQLKILGVIVSESGVRADPAKTSAIAAIPPPQTKLQMQKFLGATNYHSDFIQDFSGKISPLLKYVTETTPKTFTLNPAEMAAFQEVKDAVTKQVQLHFIDPTRPIFLECDASYHGYSGWAYQIQKYSKEDLDFLRKKQERLDKMTQGEIDAELNKILDCYIANEPLPTFDPEGSSTEPEIQDANPHLHLQTKDRKKVLEDKEFVYLVEVCFFLSRKWSKDQALAWSSLMKELTAILISVESRADLLASALYLLVVTDCAASVYLYDQSTSNSIMSRYLARLNSYPFKVLVRHKAGKYLTVADSLSRIWTVTNSKNPDKVSHLSGILVRVPFKPGSIVTVQDIIEQIEQARLPLVMSSSNPTISKASQTTKTEDGQILDPNEDMEYLPNHAKEVPLLPTPTDNIIGAVTQASNTGTRGGIKNKTWPQPPETPKTPIHEMKLELHTSINRKLDPDHLMQRQEDEFPELYGELIRGTADPRYKLDNSLILINKGGRWRRLIPPSLTTLVVLKWHLMGHYSHLRLTKLIQRTDYWPNMQDQIKTFTDSCLSCLYMRPPHGEKEALGTVLSSKNNSVWQIDTVSGLPDKAGFRYFSTVVDSFSKYAFSFAHRKDTADEICRNLTKIFAIVGPCQVLMSDGAQNMLKSNAMKQLCSRFNIHTYIRSPYSSRQVKIATFSYKSMSVVTPDFIKFNLSFLGTARRGEGN